MIFTQIQYFVSLNIFCLFLCFYIIYFKPGFNYFQSFISFGCYFFWPFHVHHYISNMTSSHFFFLLVVTQSYELASQNCFVSSKFGYIMYSFLSNSKKILISSVISVLAHFSFNRNLFSFYESVSFLLFLLLMSSFSGGQIECRILLLLSVEICFMSKYMVSFIENSISYKNEHILFCN